MLPSCSVDVLGCKTVEKMGCLKKKKLFNLKLTNPNKNYAKKTMDKEVYCAQCFIAD